MLCIVVVAGGESVKAAGKAVDRRVEVEVVIVGENNVEIAIEM